MEVSAATRGLIALATMCVVLFVIATRAEALTTIDGAPVANTGPGADPEAGFGQVEGTPNVLSDRLFDAPFDPSDEAAAAALLWSPGTPENDLAAALDAMAG